MALLLHRSQGHNRCQLPVSVEVFAQSGVDLNTLREKPPEVFVIDLTRLPAQGRDIGIWIRQRKATREVPIVFVGGEPDKVARTRKQLPDARRADEPISSCSS